MVGSERPECSLRERALAERFTVPRIYNPIFKVTDQKDISISKSIEIEVYGKSWVYDIRDYDIFAFKLDIEGNIIWYKIFTTNSRDTLADIIEVRGVTI